VIVRFLLGPAGSGKTHRCLEEVRARLKESPDGPELLFVAPKQATFQLERQLLEDPALPGYSRLRIVSFDRLAEWALDRLHCAPPPRLGESGRLMVLRALLARHGKKLRLFHASARLPGFARELSATLRELRQHRLDARHVQRLARAVRNRGALADKLQDLALLADAYQAWLEEQQVQDDQALLDAATTALKQRDRRKAGMVDPPDVAGLWLDGFAEMTPQEQELLAALLPHCRQATLAFCLEDLPEERPSWLSTWGLVGRTCQALHQRLASQPAIEVDIVRLERTPTGNRFSDSPALAHLETHWTRPTAFAGDAGGVVSVRSCATPEAEVVQAARTIREFVREGGRYREAAVIVRSLTPYRDTLRRVFEQFDIPFFLDCRESVAHHPLAELTRTATRLLTHGWLNEDWFAALKTGLLPVSEASVDSLENEAIARGWEGPKWLEPLHCPDDPGLEQRLERIRRRCVLPFLRLRRGLRNNAQQEAPRPTGRELAMALHALWRGLRVDRTLEAWAESGDGSDGRIRPQVHRSVLDQMLEWLRELARAFPTESMPLREWLPIIEAGLANLTVGVIPPALDQVLVGAIDRSRNPDLRLALLLGLNEGGFPATPPPAQLLTETDRAALVEEGVALGPDRRWRLGRERYYGYIACTRARERLVLTCARQDAQGRELNRSPFLTQIEHLFPTLPPGQTREAEDWREASHPSELMVPVLQALAVGTTETLPAMFGEAPEFAGLRQLAGVLHDPEAHAGLLPEVAKRLYGPRQLRLSVSALEEFAACPFRFLVSRGLRAADRRTFEADAQRRGSFSHAVLARYHSAVRQSGREWRDLTEEEARSLLRDTAAAVAAEFEQGLLLTSPRTQFLTSQLTGQLTELIGILTGWLRESYDLNPVEAELAFGGREARLPAWTLSLGNDRELVISGKIDRIDAATDPASGERLVVIMDYKSSGRRLDSTLLNAGVDVQLPVYLRALECLAAESALLGPEPVRGIGMFFVGLRPATASRGSRNEGVERLQLLRRKAWQHRGRYDREAATWLDHSSGRSGSGQFAGGRTDPLPRPEFQALLESVEERLRAVGTDILNGRAAVDPYVHQGSSPCDYCPSTAICRIDPWTHVYRRLPAAATTDAERA
jgi:ATP-dependent helicase/nuclease subunit B